MSNRIVESRSLWRSILFHIRRWRFLRCISLQVPQRTSSIVSRFIWWMEWRCNSFVTGSTSFTVWRCLISHLSSNLDHLREASCMCYRTVPTRRSRRTSLSDHDQKTWSSRQSLQLTLKCRKVMGILFTEEAAPFTFPRCCSIHLIGSLSALCTELWNTILHMFFRIFVLGKHFVFWDHF